MPVEVPRVVETTALGAAFLTGLAVGFWSSRDEIDAKWKLAHRYEPSISDQERAKLYARWSKAVERAKGWEFSDDPQ